MLRTFDELKTDTLSAPQELYNAVMEAAGKINDRGYRVSAGSWIDYEEMSACIFSRQCCGSATYNAPMHTIVINLK